MKKLNLFMNLMWEYHHQILRLIRLRPAVEGIGLDYQKENHEKGKNYLRFSKESTAKKITYSESRGTSPQPPNENEKEPYSLRQKIGLFLGPLSFLLILLLPNVEGLTPEGKSVGAVAVWMAVWWITEAAPIPITSLLPILLFPLVGAVSSKDATAPYANDLIFLYLGGFLLAIAIEKWNLHRRIALHVIKIFGKSLDGLVLGFMVATGFISMWISNTATTMMMIPIGLAVIHQVADIFKAKQIDIDSTPGKFNLGTSLMLGIAYSASIGGVATIIGTPPNTVLVGFVKETYNISISFAQWMTFGVPIAVVGTLFAWWYLTKLAYKTEIKKLPGGVQVIEDEIKKLGGMSKQEKQVLIVFLGVATLWIGHSFLLKWLHTMDITSLDLTNDTTIAMLGALILFLIPVNLKKNEFILGIDAFSKVPWGILLLFGGGLSLAGAMSKTGLAKWIAIQLQALENVPTLIMIFGIVTLVIFLTEITSNTSTATMLMPVMAALALAMNVHPYGLLITAAVAASFAFMLPVATPPNAIVFGTGYIRMMQMVKAGFWLNIFGIFLVSLVAYYFLPIIWGIDLNVLPDWAHIKL